MKKLLNIFALVLGFLFYPFSIILLRTSWISNPTPNQLIFLFLSYSFYLTIFWDYYVILLLFVIGLVIGAMSKSSKSEVKTVALYYLIIATFAVMFYILFQNGLSSLSSFNGRLYILTFYVLILRNGIFSFLGAILIKKLHLPPKLNKKLLEDNTTLTQLTCPYCGSTFKSNPIVCAYCGGVIDIERHNLLKITNTKE